MLYTVSWKILSMKYYVSFLDLKSSGEEIDLTENKNKISTLKK